MDITFVQILSNPPLLENMDFINDIYQELLWIIRKNYLHLNYNSNEYHVKRWNFKKKKNTIIISPLFKPTNPEIKWSNHRNGLSLSYVRKLRKKWRGQKSDQRVPFKTRNLSSLVIVRTAKFSVTVDRQHRKVTT